MKFYSHRDEAGMASLFKNSYGMEQVTKPFDADIIIWNGGEDIATSIYGEAPVSKGIPQFVSQRDKEEIELFETFAGSHRLLLGVCRGGQLLNVLNGGKLYQDVNGHHGSHNMMDIRTGEVIKVTSTHHQQFRPHKSGQVIGLSSESTAKHADNLIEHPRPTIDLRDGLDVEIVWYPKSRSLCVQGHPEYVPGSKFADYTLNLINEFFKAA